LRSQSAVRSLVAGAVRLTETRARTAPCLSLGTPHTLTEGNPRCRIRDAIAGAVGGEGDTWNRGIDARERVEEELLLGQCCSRSIHSPQRANWSSRVPFMLLVMMPPPT